MNLLFVDDESTVRDYLKSAVDWTNHGYTVFEAENGKAAIELMQMQSIDFILLDITMPLLDGFAVLKWMRENRYKAAASLLTCHDEFEYAKAAVQTDCMEYVLKTELTGESVLALVDRMREKYSREQHTAQSIQELEGLTKYVVLKQHQALLLNWLSGTIGGHGTVSDLSALFSSSHAHSKYACFLLLADGVCLREAAMEVSSLYIQQTLHLLVEKNAFGLSPLYTETQPNVFFFIIPFSHKDTITQMVAQLQEITRQVKGDLAHTLNVKSHVIFSLPYDDLALTHSLYHRMLALSRSAFFVAMEAGVCLDDFITDKETITKFLSSFEEQLERELIARDFTAVELCLAQLQLDAQERRLALSMEQVARHMQRVLSRFCLLHMQSKQIVEIIGEWPTYGELKSGFLKQIEPFCISQENQSKKAVIKKCILLIQQNYSSEISLEWLSEKLWVSAGYLSRIFSEEMNQTITSFVQNIRIEQAKYLIRTQPLKLYEIGTQVGFSSAITFSTVFKKIVGQTPTEYRNSVL